MGSTSAAGASDALVKADEPAKARKSQKANIDATSDEEEDE